MGSLRDLVDKQNGNKEIAEAPAAPNTPLVGKASADEPAEAVVLPQSEPSQPLITEGVSASSEETDGSAPVIMHDEAATQFLHMVKGIPDLFQDPDALASSIRGVLFDLQASPHFEELLEPQDIGLMIRGMREALGIAAIRKADNKAKKGGKKKAPLNMDLTALENLDLGEFT
jgi:hypothetical protein